ncbi:MAG: guanylate kinase [Gammaproteobacteria bacterium]|nr:guanylate kinase [Gammaproteobacteria bacterium]
MNSACLFTISAPSGAGKTSLIKALLAKKSSSIVVSVSHSTRLKRPGEVDGVDYHFVNIEQFEAMVEQDEFIEHAKVFDNYYGTARASVEKLLESGRHVILEIDWQGARQVKQAMPETIGIFILPPSRAALQQRLIDRATDDRSTIERRMLAADREMSHYHDAEFLVINEDFEQALYDLECIIHSQGMTLARQKVRNNALIESIPEEIV